MKFLISLVILGVFVSNAQAVKVHCDSAQTAFGNYKVPEEWVTMNSADSCLTSMRGHIQHELNAALTYMAMGAHFSKDTINRPGFSEFFFKSASEEREHAIKLIEYMSMRGDMHSNLKQLIPSPFKRPKPMTWESGINALTEALKLETTVTNKIKNIIAECEKDTATNTDGNDYHLVDYLTGEFLTEQYTGQRDLAGKLSTLSKLVHHQGSLGEFIFDKKMLNGEL